MAISNVKLIQMKSGFYTLFLLTITSISFSQVLPVELSQLVRNSEMVVEGEVIAKTSFQDPVTDAVLTRNTIKVMSVLGNSKANVGSTIEVITQGGELEDMAVTVSHSMQLSVGQVGMFFLVNNGKNSWKSNTGPLGFVRYQPRSGKAIGYFKSYPSYQTFRGEVEKAANATLKTVGDVPIDEWILVYQSTIAIRSTANLGITGFSPAATQAGTDQVLTISGTGFGSNRNGQTVLFSNADDGGASIDVEAESYLSWSDTEIQVIVPSGAGTGPISVEGTESTNDLTIDYNITKLQFPGETGPFQFAHFDDSGSGGYIFEISSQMDAQSGARATLNQVMSSWVCTSTINFTIAETANSSVNTDVQDGVNIIGFVNNLPSNILGQCRTYYAKATCNGNDDRVIIEMDLTFNNTKSWEFAGGTPSGTQYDFETVALHELGHGHQLGHVIDNSDVMHYAIGTGTTQRSLSSNNSAAALYVDSFNDSYTFDCTQDFASMTPGTCISGNDAPTATASFTGEEEELHTLSGSYAYSDTEDDAEGTHFFKWFRADNTSGSNEVEINGATSINYTLQAADVGKYIRFGIVPVSTTGTSPGALAKSSFSGRIAPAAPSNMTATALSATQIRVNWQDNSTAEDGFVIEYAEDSGFTVNKKSVSVNFSNVTSQTISDLSAGTEYFFRVAAVRE